MSKKLVPFHLMPGAWGLKGKTREIAQAEYELEGYELESKMLEIKSDEYSTKELARRKIDLDFRYNKITQVEQLRALAELIDNEEQRGLAMLELDYRENKITDQEFQKQSATLRKEPWVTVLNMDFAGDKSLEGSFELDWNSFFVEQLKDDGYQGPTPDSIVNQWFMTVCKNVALEEFDGTGNFSADAEANLDAVERWANDSLNGNKRIYK